MFRYFCFALPAVLVSVATSGCAPTPSEQPAVDGHVHEAEAEDAHGDALEHSHVEEAPHGGLLVELGDCQYHAELVHDDEAGSLTVYLWDAEVTQPVSSDQSEITLQLLSGDQFVAYQLAAAADSADAAGGAARFEIVDAGLSEAFHESDLLRGRLSVTIGGEPYVGDVQHTAHDHDAEHDHAEDHDHDAEHDHADGHDQDAGHDADHDHAEDHDHDE